MSLHISLSFLRTDFSLLLLSMTIILLRRYSSQKDMTIIQNAHYVEVLYRVKPAVTYFQMPFSLIRTSSSLLGHFPYVSSSPGTFLYFFSPTTAAYPIFLNSNQLQAPVIYNFLNTSYYLAHTIPNQLSVYICVHLQCENATNSFLYLAAYRCNYQRIIPRTIHNFRFNVSAVLPSEIVATKQLSSAITF